ncbi:MAG: S1 RNA-binding domain-containing protein [Anaerolineales bacterium]|nr:S1 RNA-binding domain-containing protein [Anaerolineales bacterium]
MSEVTAPLNPLAGLAPNQALKGTISRVELFGAFVEVGAEAPGLVHISRLSPRKVNRVAEVVSLGQQVDVWVVSADPNGKRLELTMVPPVTLKWMDIQPGMQVSGRVVKLERYGAFVEIGAERPGMIHVSEMAEGYVSNPADILHPGDEVTARVVEVDRQKRQIRLSLKQLVVEETVDEDEAETEEMATSMEAAFRRAMQTAEPGSPAGQEPPQLPSKKGRSQQEDILARTLKHRVH